MFGDQGVVITILMLSAGILLLIVCFNIAGMMLARSGSRSREIGIRTALGVSRAGIIRQFLTESLLLSIPGVLLGLLLGQAVLKLMAVNIKAPSWIQFTPDIPLITFCVVLTGASTIFFGLMPALSASRVNVQRSLHKECSGSSPGISKHRGLKILVVGEVAFAVMLLVASGLLLRAWQKVSSVDPGFGVDNLFTFNLKLPSSGFESDFFERLVKNLRQVPGIIAVSGSNTLPMSGKNKFQFDTEGVDPHKADPMILMRWILPDYFKTMGIPLMAGRDFSADDGRTTDSNVAIVSQSFAERHWPGADPIGKRIRIREENDWQGQWRKEVGLDQWMTVIGLSRNVTDFGPDRDIEPVVYIPYYKWQVGYYYIIVRSSVAPGGILNLIQSQLRKLDPDVGIFSPRTMAEVIEHYNYDRRILAIIMVLFAVAALLIAAAGVFGIVNYTVSRRTHEIGIRMALGAMQKQVLKMVFGESMRLMLAGAIFGLVGAFLASRIMKSMLFSISTLDVPTYLVVVALLMGTVTVATLIPARRAARTDPMQALRSE